MNDKRPLFLFIILLSSLLIKAQAPKQNFKDSSYYTQHVQNKKWFLTSYSNIGIGFNFFNGSTATLVSAPVGLQLNRQLNNNFYAFTGVSLAPTYINFNHSFFSSGIKPYTGNGFKSDNLGLYSSVNMGLTYVNDARTFSISSSIGVERSNYPMLFYPHANMQRVSTFTPTPVYR
jgi:hypothetical protein